jgi:hypothetical protein
LVSGACFGIVLAFTQTIKLWLTDSPSGLNVITTKTLLYLLVRWSSIGVLSGVTCVAVMALFRALVFAVVEQDGNRCWSCTYPVGKSRSGVCPECGNKFKERRNVAVWVTQTAGRRAMHASIMLIILAIGFGFLIVRQQMAILAFVSVFEYKTHPAIFAGFGTEGPERGAFISDPDQFGHGQTAIVTLHCPSIFEAARIRIYGGNFHETHSNVTYAQGRHDRIWCELNPEQTRLTLASGLPSALQDELIRIAADQGWNPNGKYASLNDVSMYFTEEDSTTSH